MSPPGSHSTKICDAAPRSVFVGIGHMANAIAALTGGAGGGGVHVMAIQQLPPQQQLIIIAAVRLLRESCRRYTFCPVYLSHCYAILNRCCSPVRYHDACVCRSPRRQRLHGQLGGRQPIPCVSCQKWWQGVHGCAPHFDAMPSVSHWVTCRMLTTTGDNHHNTLYWHSRPPSNRCDIGQRACHS